MPGINDIWPWVSVIISLLYCLTWKKIQGFQNMGLYWASRPLYYVQSGFQSMHSWSFDFQIELRQMKVFLVALQRLWVESPFLLLSNTFWDFIFVQWSPACDHPQLVICSREMSFIPIWPLPTNSQTKNPICVSISFPCLNHLFLCLQLCFKNPAFVSSS